MSLHLSMRKKRGGIMPMPKESTSDPSVVSFVKRMSTSSVSHVNSAVLVEDHLRSRKWSFENDSHVRMVQVQIRDSRRLTFFL